MNFQLPHILELPKGEIIMRIAMRHMYSDLFSFCIIVNINPFSSSDILVWMMQSHSMKYYVNIRLSLKFRLLQMSVMESDFWRAQKKCSYPKLTSFLNSCPYNRGLGGRGLTFDSWKLKCKRKNLGSHFHFSLDTLPPQRLFILGLLGLSLGSIYEITVIFGCKLVKLKHNICLSFFLNYLILLSILGIRFEKEKCFL